MKNTFRSKSSIAHGSWEKFPDAGNSSRIFNTLPDTPNAGDFLVNKPMDPELVCPPVEPFTKDWFNTMADQTKMNLEHRGNRNGRLKTGDCSETVPECNPKEKRFVDITAMIRSLQRTEGLTDCFRSGLGDCDQLKCAWRQYCLGNGKHVWTNSDDEC